ncbi:MAG: hypothetical protein IAG13_39150, partial [Deltaproteobacteria bacterium]|nr:hypothetical protein [Nannocystaceae bacterium]
MPDPGIALAGWLAWSTIAAPATSDRAHIEWQAPAQCPSAAAVDVLAERLLLSSDADVHATATVSPAERGGYVLELRIADAPTSRTWHAPGCEQLAELAALVVAIAADPVTVAASIPDPPRSIDDERRGPAAGTATQEAEVRPRPSRRADRPGKPRDWHGLVAAHGVFGVAELPRFDAGVGLAVGIGRRRWRIELGATHLFAQIDEIPRSGGVHARLAAWNTSALACGLFGRRRIGLAICGGPELGALTAEAPDAPTPVPNTLLWVAGL